MDEVVNDRAQSHVGVSSHLKLDEPGVISKAAIAKPVYEIIRVAFLGDDGYGNTRLR